MKERPILFNGPMVRAILGSRKTQTRRAMKPQPVNYPRSGYFYIDTCWGDCRIDYAVKNGLCPYGKPGDRLWVRETFYIIDEVGGPTPKTKWTHYRADLSNNLNDPCQWKGPWKPSIHMPRWASRITLEIIDIRVERVQEISRQDAKAEGFWPSMNGLERWNGQSYGNAQLAFQACWKDIIAPESWDQNPWVWVVEFKRANP